MILSVGSPAENGQALLRLGQLLFQNQPLQGGVVVTGQHFADEGNGHAQHPLPPGAQNAAQIQVAAIRFLLLRSGQSAYTADHGLHVYRRVAFGMLLLTTTMGGVLFQMIRDAAAFEYPGILIYAMAVYAFAKIISAIMNLIRRRRDEDRILAAARCVSFAGALMSILALQTALISQFGKPEELFARIMTGVSGCAVLVILIALSAAMLVKSGKRVAH